MATNTMHRLTLDPMGKCSNAFFSETIGMKNINFVKDLPMIIPGQFGFNCPSGFHECSLDGPLQTLRFLLRYEIQNGGYGRT
jgi:hypothetical protein